MTHPSGLSYTTSEDTFVSDGTECAVRLYRPDGLRPPVPVIVMAHGLGAVRALRLYAYAEQFAAAGYAVAVFDYRGFGDSAGTPRQVIDVRMQHQDWRAALAYARDLPGIDRQRVVAWGTSFGGGHVISIAGQGEDLAAIIAQVPHVSGPAAVRATGFLPSLRVGIQGMRDQVNAWVGREPVYVNAAGHPGETAVMTSPDAAPGLDKLLAESGLEPSDYPRTVAARIVLRIGLYSPKRWARGVTCPALVQVADQDAVTPRHVAEAAAARMAAPTVRIYSGGHFEPYVEPLFSTIIADQLAFLREHVPPPARQD